MFKLIPICTLTCYQTFFLFLYRPVHCSDLLYDVMCQCHQPEAKDRPSFEDILTKLLKENTESEKQTPLT